MKLFGRELAGYSRQIAISVAVLLVSSGLCGIQYAAWQGFVGGGNQSIGNATVGAFWLLGAAELIAIGLSTLWIVVILVAWLASSLYEHFGKRQKNKVQSRFDSNSDTGDDDSQ